MSMEHEQTLTPAQAVSLLVTHPEARRLYASLEAVTRLSTQYPVALTGEAAGLNVLVELLDAAEIAALNKRRGLK